MTPALREDPAGPPSESGSGTSSRVPGAPRWRRLALPVVLAFVCLPLLTKFDNGFVYDDVAVIVDSDFIHDPANIAAAFAHHTMVASAVDGPVAAVDTYRPVTLLTFFWDAQVSGRSPFSYHLTNLVLHLGCVALVFFWSRRLFGDGRAPAEAGDPVAWAALVALFFGVSPWIAEGHVWINGRSDPLCTLLGLGAVLVGQRASSATGWRRGLGMIGASALFFAGLLSKEVLLLLLPAILAAPGPGGERRTLRQRLAGAAGFIAAAALYLVLRGAVLSGMQAISDQGQLLLALRRLPVLLIDGVIHLVAPAPPSLRSLAEAYAFVTPAVAAAAYALIGVVALAAWRLRRRAPLIPFGLLVYAPPLAPAAIIATMSWGGFGRYLYLPSVGVALCLAAAARLLYARDAGPAGARARRLLTIGLGAYVAVLAVVLALSVGSFHDQETFYRSAIDGAPEHALGYSLLAAEHQRLEEFRQARDLYERAISLDPSRPKYAESFAAVLLALGEVDRARAVAEDAIGRLPPGTAGTFRAVVVGSVLATEPDEAVRQVLTCLAEDPGAAPCRRWAHAFFTHPGLSPTYGPLLSAAAAAEEFQGVRPTLREIAAIPPAP